VSADWTSKPVLGVDCESTSVDPFTARIVEVACVDVAFDGEVSDAWGTIVDPGIEIPDEAAQVHGIPTSRAVAEGVQPAEALAYVAERIYQAAIERRPVVIQNARYDLPLLICEAERHGIDFPCLTPILDPLLLDRMVDRYRRGKRTLVAACGVYGVEFDDGEAHSALADATASARVLWRLLERYPTLGEVPLARMFLDQVKGYEDWRDGFVDYRRRNFDPSFDIAPGWPLPAGANT
jgi:DNA polymerase-3 subunit epsilon